mmetsp:Transcript_41399/g.96690  ORF Transcript_41399/g.96690 Transcript_41399/m.96690 type:complete len:266 (+) Transcript_41399:1007-1804(+)
MRPTGSTPTVSNALRPSGLSNILRNSACDMSPSPSSSAARMISKSSRFTRSTRSSSRSLWPTMDTTSQSTPMSMFIRVMEAISTKTMNRPNATELSPLTSATSSAMSSINTPWISKVSIASGTVGKRASPMPSPTQICLKAMPKMYKTNRSRQMVKNTDRAAALMPLIMMSTSGKARRSFATRVIRASLSSRTRRRIEASPMPSLEMLRTPSTMGVIQVSRIIKVTSNVSNTNQASLNANEVLLKAIHRTIHSNVKKAQKMFSTI